VDLTLHPDKAAVVMGDGTRVTYGEMEARSVQFARVLHDLGLGRGDHIAVYSENHARFFEVFWAAMRSGLIFTPINWHFKADEAAYLIDDCGASVFVTTVARREMARGALELATRRPRCFMIDGVAPGFRSYEAALAGQPTKPLAGQLLGEIMLYSSGTTGRPKGIARPITGAVWDDVEFGPSTLARHLLGIGEHSVYLCPTPLYHSAGLSWTAAVHGLGATAVIMEKFDAEQLLQLIERERVTHLQVVPTMFVRLLKLDDATRSRYDLSSLERVVHAAAPCPVDVKRRLIDWLGPIVDEYYAATEGHGFTFIAAGEWLRRPGSVGRPIFGAIHICDDDGHELASGEPGLVYFETEGMSFAYHGDPEKTAGLRHPTHGNWVALGDVGYVDDDGYLYLTDRKSFMIISGGVNIYPAEIEGCLLEHRDVADAAVFGLPDPEMGEFVQAVVQLDPGVAPTPEKAAELRDHVRGRLAGFKVPRVVDFVEHLPREANGKLYKGRLKDAYLTGAQLPGG
jgi:acyl-CoA synthetase (AMP-forming)/AMP-acid ligase II